MYRFFISLLFRTVSEDYTQQLSFLTRIPRLLELSNPLIGVLHNWQHLAEDFVLFSLTNNQHYLMAIQIARSRACAKSIH